MSTLDRYGSAERSGDRGAREVGASWLAQASTWFALAIAGMLVVFVGLGIDAWRHDNGAEEESLLSLGNPGHLVAGIGLLITSLAALIGFSATALRGVDSAQSAVRRMVPVTAAWVAVAAVGISSITYIGATGATVGHSDHGDSSVAAGDHDHDDAVGEAGIADALDEEGLIGDDVDPSTVRGALTQGASGHPDGRHDHGKQPTFAQWTALSDAELLPLFPEGTVKAEDLPLLREQIMAVRSVAERYKTVEDANAAGYVNTTSDVPFMGMHFLNFNYVRDGKFDPLQPEGLLFSKVDDGPPKLVGVWFLLLPGVGEPGLTREVQPEGFASDLDLWHAHLGLCLVGTEDASEGETRESCDAKGGRFTADLRWMMHVWVADGFDNPDGAFAYLNGDLYKQQVAAQGFGEGQEGTIAE